MSDKPRLAIVGASARAAAFSALRAGFDVVTADLFADEDLRRRCPATRIDNYPEGLAAWLAQQDVDAWMYTGALENYPDLVDEMAEIKPLWGNKGEALRRCRDPFELQRVCREHGLNFPETRKSAEGLPLDGSWLCKTYRGAGGSGVSELSEYTASPCTSYQKYAFGMPSAAVFAIEEHRSLLLGVTEQLVNVSQLHAPQWAYCGSIEQPDWSDHYKKSLAALGYMLRVDFGLRGLVGVDLVVVGKKLCVIEVNPRYTASTEVVDSTRAEPSVGSHARCFSTLTLRSTPQSSTINGKAILFARENTIVGGEFHQLMLKSSVRENAADIPAAGTRINRGDPVLTLLVRGYPGLQRDYFFKLAQRIEARLY